MTDQGSATQAASSLDGTFDATIQAIAKDIASSLYLNPEKTRAVMNLPPASQTDNESLASALQFILGKHFSINFPAQEMTQVQRGDETVSFKEERLDQEQPPRSVTIMLAASHRLMEVNGMPAEDGRDARSELFFPWKKQAGAVDEHGNIDLKKLNVYPGIQKDKPLAKIYLHTPGTPGVDALGKRIKPRSGRPMKIRYNEGVIYPRDEPEDPTCFQLMAARSGIIDFSLTQKDNPATLQSLDIVDTITVNGDVNYKVGDLGSLTDKDLTGAANIVVKGDVLGVFTLQSEGFIHVNGSIEGKKVVANEVKAAVIGSETSVLARERLVAGTVIQARVSAGTVVLQHGSNESVFQVSKLMRLEKNCSCLALKIDTRKLEADHARFSGQNIINLGRSLFEEEKEIQAGKQTLDRLMKAELPELRELAKNAITHLLDLEFHTNKATNTIPPSIAQVVGLIKTHLATTMQQMTKALNPNLIPACYRLQAMLGENHFHEGVLRKVETLVSALRKFDEELQIREEHWQRLGALENREIELREEVKELSAEFDQPQLSGSNSEIHIACGEQELLFTPGQIPTGSFCVRYAPPEDAESLAHGQLDVSEAL